jgi:3-oxoacyl-[acyl-carrier protein] reductase
VPDLRGMVAVVTGGVRGTRLSAVRALAESGAAVELTGRDETCAEQIAAELDGTVEGLAPDVAGSGAATAVIRGAAKEYGRPDIAAAAFAEGRSA